MYKDGSRNNGRVQSWEGGLCCEGCKPEEGHLWVSEAWLKALVNSGHNVV